MKGKRTKGSSPLGSEIWNCLKLNLQATAGVPTE